jgi:hypothetical protein
MRWLVLIGILVSSSIAAPPPAREKPATNLEGIADWSAVLPFADAIKSSRRFGSAEKPWDQSARIDARGWPVGNKDVGLVIFADQRGIAGRYELSFTGKGHVESIHGPSKIEDLDYDPSKNQTRASVVIPESERPISLFLSFTELGEDGLKDLQLIRPVARRGSFDLRFIELLQHFSAVRFMDWGHTNGSMVKDWGSRPLPEDQRYAGKKGVPLEVQIELAHQAGVDAWFCMPHLADDDYVRKAAELVCDTLDEKRHVYIELSNECWNGMFDQARWCAEQGKQVGLSDNPYQAQLRFYSQRAVEICRIWQEVFQAKGQEGRLTRVMATQAANPWVSEQVLTWQDAHKEVDALAVAPYFGGEFGRPQTAAMVARMSPEALIDGLREKSLGEAVPAMLQQQKEWADKYNLALLAYEGGQHLAGHGGAENNEKLVELFIGTNRHPGMRELYKDYIGLWNKTVDDPASEKIFWFSLSSKHSKWGSWGLIDSLPPDPGKHPKWAAVVGK